MLQVIIDIRDNRDILASMFATKSLAGCSSRFTRQLKALQIAKIASNEDMQHYKTDTQTLARWLDVSIVKRAGRAFDADKKLINRSEAEFFPTVKGTKLDGTSISVPGDVNASAKLVIFSFKHYGFTLLRSWLDPFTARYPEALGEFTNGDKAKGMAVAEICFIEYGFLSMAKTVFASNIKKSIPDSQIHNTILSFGGVTDFAAQLLLPNKYTGYAYLLDKNDKIRWRGSGQATDEEVETLLKCAKQLLSEK